MSQEQPPIRSRRELRKARDAAQGKVREAGTTGAGEVAPASKAAAAGQPAAKAPAANQPAAAKAPAGQAAAKAPAAKQPAAPANTGRVRRVAPGPVDSVPAGQAAERSSQVRARDRAALRTIKELAEKEGQLSGGGPPTRRQLRLMELEKAVTSAIPVVPPASGQPNPAAPAQGKTPAGPAVSAPSAAPARPAVQGQAPAQPKTAPQAAAETPPGIPNELPEGMTVEQALEARALIAEQAKNQIAKMEHIAATDPEAVDPEILAQQIALAERAAILNKRAMAKQKLAEKNTPAQPDNGPSTASNLAMVTPLEFVQVPGVERPVMKRPATSYVPVVTNPGPRVPARGTKPPKAPRSAGSAPSTGRSRVIARAEAAARAASSPPAAKPAARQAPAPQSAAAPPAAAPDTESNEEFAALPPVSAKSAYGLDPLDAATAGLGRANRLRLLQVGVLALGLMALMAGIIMIISGLSR
ncbi:hypothetical protein ACIP9X_11965 [Arthrobacter sp. NPDC093125]|uniref:hypothetical protein n=1 Tax=Arthrobacter sp. NPDC093125 TaxID=3363944 RepID=UPI00382A52CC